jgi:hypothetical protein
MIKMVTDKDGNDVNWTTKQFHCWKPTVALALKFIRKRFQIQHHINDRHWNAETIGFGVWFSFTHLDCIAISLMENTDENEDGVISFDYDEAEKIALDYILRYLIKNYTRDFSWLKIGKYVYVGNNHYEKGIIVNKFKVLEVYNTMKLAKITSKDDTYKSYFYRLYKTPEEALESYKKEFAQD